MKTFEQLYTEKIIESLDLKEWLKNHIAESLYQDCEGDWVDDGCDANRVDMFCDFIKEDFIGPVYNDIYDNDIELGDIRLGNVLDLGIEKIAKNIFEEIYDECKEQAILDVE